MGVDVCWQGFRRGRCADLFDGLYFHVKGIDFIHIIIFDLTGLLLNFFIKFELERFDVAANYSVDTNIFNPLL